MAISGVHVYGVGRGEGKIKIKSPKNCIWSPLKRLSREVSGGNWEKREREGQGESIAG